MKLEKGMYGYTIKINSRCTHSEREPEQYGSWSESYSNDLDRKVTKTDKYPDAVSPFDFKPGSNALVVWVEWSSGDSFGHGECSGTEVLGIFKDMESAAYLKTQLDALYENVYGSEKPNGYDITTHDGQVFKSGFAPWAGYFERLNYIHVDMVTVW